MKIPNLKIPVTIDASGLEGDLRKAEIRMKKSAERVAKIRSAATPALGALGGGALGGIAGGLGQFGLAGGAVGTGIMAAAAPMLFANRVIDAFAQATKGSTEALKQFRDTGVNATGINSALLETLAAMEQRAQQIAGGPTMAQAFLGGAGTDANFLIEGASLLKEGALGLSSALGAITSGKTLEQAFLAMQLPTAKESRAEQLTVEMNQAQAKRRPFDAGYLDLLGVGNPLVYLTTQLARAFT